mmetsp:Transcript_1265/g.2054  ORF Transcript_1265/g.2054 Transcript_1265/m.2054 type:complete len:330 (+) Transcript_1265:701-1690(+)
MFPVLLGMLDCPGLPALGDKAVRPRVSHAHGRAPLEGSVAVADALELFPNPAGLHALLVAGQVHGALVRADRARLRHGVEPAVGRQPPERRLRRDQPRLHGGVGALDLDPVEKAGPTAKKCTTGEVQFGDGVEAALVQDARPVLHALAPREVGRDQRVVLPALELLVHIEVGILVICANHKACENQIRLHVIKKASPKVHAEWATLQWPSKSVLDIPRLDVLWGHLPHFLDPMPKGLVLFSLPQIEDFHHLLAGAAPGALGQEGQPAAQLHAPLERVLPGAVLGEAHVPRGHAQHPRAVRGVQHLGCSKTRIDLNPHVLRFFCKPPCQL